MLQVDDIVRCVNKGDHPLELAWDSKFYVLHPGKDSFVPFSAMTNALGDPRSTETMISVKNEHGVIGWVPDRATEIRRLRAKYDNQFGDERYVVNYPNVEVYTLEGERILTVLEDQDGTSVNPAATTIGEASEQAGQVAVLLQQQKEMKEQLDRLLGLTPPEQPEVPPEDTSVTADAIKLQDLTMPPEDSGGDIQRSYPQEKTPPEPGSPKLDWNSLNATTE